MKNSELLLDALTERYPHLFSSPPIPLKIGIRYDFLSYAGDIAVSKTQINKALKRWTRRNEYLSALIAGGPRYGLAGKPEGPPVTPKQQEIAKASLVEQEA